MRKITNRERERMKGAGEILGIMSREMKSVAKGKEGGEELSL